MRKFVIAWFYLTLVITSLFIDCRDLWSSIALLRWKDNGPLSLNELESICSFEYTTVVLLWSYASDTIY